MQQPSPSLGGVLTRPRARREADGATTGLQPCCPLALACMPSIMQTGTRSKTTRLPGSARPGWRYASTTVAGLAALLPLML